MYEGKRASIQYNEQCAALDKRNLTDISKFIMRASLQHMGPATCIVVIHDEGDYFVAKFIGVNICTGSKLSSMSSKTKGRN